MNIKSHKTGRGARTNRASRYEPVETSAFDDGWGETDPPAAPIKTEIRPLTARSIVTKNTSPDINFDRTINPYKGCEHGCIYCYARPNHAYLGYSPGLDFESRIFWKPGAADRLEQELARPNYRPALMVIGGDTDPYQPVEKRLGVTRSLVEVLSACRHPVALVTKSALVLRDLDLLAPMAADGLAGVAVSITTLDRTLARAMEPRAATPERRLEAIKRLAAAGIPVRVMAAPMIPGLNDHELEAILEQAAHAGATQAGFVLIRLPLEIKDLFGEWLEAHSPERAKKVMSLIRQTRGGAAYETDWFTRGRGRGPIAELLSQRFNKAVGRLGLAVNSFPLRTDLFRRPRLDGQADLFDSPMSNGGPR